MRPTWAHGLKKGVNLLSKFCSPGEQWGLGLGATYTLPRLIQIPWVSLFHSQQPRPPQLSSSSTYLTGALGTEQLRAHWADRALLEELPLHLLAI